MKKALIASLAVPLMVIGLLPTLAIDASASEKARPSLQDIVSAGAPGVASSVSSGGRTQNYAFGLANIDARVRADATYSTRVGSITKSMVATVVMQLVDESKLSLNDSLATYLPDVVPNADAISIRDLLQHTSGLPDYSAKLFDSPDRVEAFRYRSFTREELVAAALKGEPKQLPPGKWSYSNLNYVLAGMVIEKITGHPVSEELRQRVFLPAGMNQSILRNEDPNISGPHFEGYLITPGSTKPSFNVSTYTPTIWSSAGGVISTTDDLNKFFQALFGGRLVSQNSLQQMTTTVSTGSPMLKYGLGIESFPLPCAPGGVVWGHDGSVFGYFALSLTTSDATREVSLTGNTFPVTPDLIKATIRYAESQICAPAS